MLFFFGLSGTCTQSLHLTTTAVPSLKSGPLTSGALTHPQRKRCWDTAALLPLRPPCWHHPTPPAAALPSTSPQPCCWLCAPARPSAGFHPYWEWGQRSSSSFLLVQRAQVCSQAPTGAEGPMGREGAPAMFGALGWQSPLPSAVCWGHIKGLTPGMSLRRG